MSAATMVTAVGRRVRRGAGRRLAERPRLATSLMHLPAIVPARRLRSRLHRSFSWPLAIRVAAEVEVGVVGANRMLVRQLAVGEHEGCAALYEGTGTNSGLATLSAALAAKGDTGARDHGRCCSGYVSDTGETWPASLR
jgi:hypothetical protein